MKVQFAPSFVRSRLVACFAVAGLVFAPAALAQTQLPPPSAYGPADARQDRIEALEQQLNEATAENERLQHQLMQTNRELTRLRAMVGELAAVNQSAVESAQPPEGSAPPPRTVAPPPAPGGQANGAQARATGTLGTLPATQLPGEAGPAYSRARELLVNGNYAEAEAAFGEFLRVFPSADTAADARFWFAFTLLARNNYTDAAANFVQYLRDAPRGPRAPEAQVRLGMALAGMGETRQACGAFASLQRSYPNAPRAVRELAVREAGAARCS